MNTHEPAERPRLYTEQETADILRCSRRTVRRYVAKGDLVVVRRGGRSLYDPKDVDDFIERSKSTRLDDAPTWGER